MYILTRYQKKIMHFQNSFRQTTYIVDKQPIHYYNKHISIFGLYLYTLLYCRYSVIPNRLLDQIHILFDQSVIIFDQYVELFDQMRCMTKVFIRNYFFFIPKCPMTNINSFSTNNRKLYTFILIGAKEISERRQFESKWVNFLNFYRPNSIFYRPNRRFCIRKLTFSGKKGETRVRSGAISSAPLTTVNHVNHPYDINF